jgi:hypothetical protein
MNRRLNILVLAIGLSAPFFAAAQSSSQQGTTREQVRQELVEYEAAGFNPARQNPRTWVYDAQAASAKVSTEQVEVSAPHLAKGGAEDAAHCN